MHGVPADLKLDLLVGTRLIEIGLSPHQVQLHFEGVQGGDAGRVSVAGGYWELHASDGTLVDWTQEPFERDCYRLHRILGCDVTGFSMDPPRSCTLRFASGHEFTAFDDSQHYESFSVHLPGQPDVHV
jgi:hypothetical protein